MKTFIRVKKTEQLKAAAKFSGADTWIVPGNIVEREICKNVPEIYIDLPDILRESDMEGFRRLIKSSELYKGVVVKNIDELGLLKEMDYRGGVIGDAFLYAYNNEAIRYYLELFPEMMFLSSDELTAKEMTDLGHKDRMILKVYGHQQLMITAQCFGKNYSDCRRKEIRFRDGQGDRFFSLSSCEHCYSTVYNGKPTIIADKDLPGTDKILFDFTRGHYVRGID